MSKMIKIVSKSQIDEQAIRDCGGVIIFESELKNEKMEVVEYEMLVKIDHINELPKNLQYLIKQ